MQGARYRSTFILLLVDNQSLLHHLLKMLFCLQYDIIESLQYVLQSGMIIPLALFILLRITTWGAFLIPGEFYGILTEERQKKIQKERDCPKQYKYCFCHWLPPKHKIKTCVAEDTACSEHRTWRNQAGSDQNVSYLS